MVLWQSESWEDFKRATRELSKILVKVRKLPQGRYEVVTVGGDFFWQATIDRPQLERVQEELEGKQVIRTKGAPESPRLGEPWHGRIGKIDPARQFCFLEGLTPCGGEVRYNPKLGYSVCASHSVQVFRIAQR